MTKSIKAYKVDFKESCLQTQWRFLGIKICIPFSSFVTTEAASSLIIFCLKKNPSSIKIFQNITSIFLPIKKKKKSNSSKTLQFIIFCEGLVWLCIDKHAPLFYNKLSPLPSENTTIKPVSQDSTSAQEQDPVLSNTPR